MKTSKIVAIVCVAALIIGFVLAAGCSTQNASVENENTKKISELETQVKNLTEELDKIKTESEQSKNSDASVKNESTAQSQNSGAITKTESAKTQDSGAAAKNESTKTTLKSFADHLEGETEALGYLIIQKEKLFDDSYSIGYFALINADKVLTDWIKKIYASGNTVNKIGKYPMLGIGCDRGSMFDGTWLKITGTNYTALKNSSEKNPVKVKLVFFNPPDIGGACLTFLKDLKAL